MFGAALRLFRVDAGTSLRGLAATVGVSSAYLSRVENGRDAPPTPDRLVAIAVALGVPPSLLVELAERVEPAVGAYLAEVPAANELFLEIARRRLNAAQVDRLLRFVEAEFPDPAPRGPPSPPLAALLTPDRVLIGVRCSDLDDILDLAASRLVTAYPGTSAAALSQALRTREAAASNALGAGLVVPHTPFPGGSPAAVLITLSTPVSAGPDGLPLRTALVIAGASPTHMLLPRIVRLTRGDLLLSLAAATTPEGAIQVMEAAERWSGLGRAW